MNLLNLLAALVYVHIAALLPRPANLICLALAVVLYWLFTGLDIVPTLTLRKEY